MVTCSIFLCSRMSDCQKSLPLSDILDSDQLPIVFHLMYHIRTTNPSGQVGKLTDWERFQSLASELSSPRIQINSGEEADKTARDFTPSTVSAYWLSTNKITLPGLNRNVHGLESLLKHTRRLEKLWQARIQHANHQLIGSPKLSD
jgi:hypothetical protein